MFGFGISEIMAVLIVAIVLINPKELPMIVRKIGKIYASVMRQINGVRRTFSSFEEDVKSMTDFKEFKENNRLQE